MVEPRLGSEGGKFQAVNVVEGSSVVVIVRGIFCQATLVPYASDSATRA